MKFLEDKEYEEMDWLTQSVEPHLFSLNDTLRTLPDKHVFTYQEMVKLINKDIDTAIHMVAPNMIDYQSVREVTKFFKFEIEENTIINTAEAKILSGSVTLIKTQDQFSEEEMAEHVCNKVYQIRYNRNCELANMPMSDVHDLLDIFECPKEAYKTTSRKKKVQAVQHAIRTILREDKWRIRNMDLAKKIIDWTAQYVENGNLGAFANLAKLKCMTLKKEPIYSIGEIV